MAVDSGSQRFLRVIEMERADVLDADMAIELVDGALVPAAGSDVIARGKDVAGINADAQACRIVDDAEDLTQLIKRAAQAGTLTSRGLEQSDYFAIGHGPMNLIEGAGDAIDPPFCARPHVRAGMKNHRGHTELFGALQLHGHSGDGLLVKRRINRRQVDEVLRVNEDRRSAALVSLGSECSAIFPGERLTRPLELVPGKQRQRSRADRPPALKDRVHAALDRHMRAEEIRAGFAGESCASLHEGTSPGGSSS